MHAVFYRKHARRMEPVIIILPTTILLSWSSRVLDLRRIPKPLFQLEIEIECLFRPRDSQLLQLLPNLESEPLYWVTVFGRSRASGCTMPCLRLRKVKQ